MAGPGPLSMARAAAHLLGHNRSLITAMTEALAPATVATSIAMSRRLQAPCRPGDRWIEAGPVAAEAARAASIAPRLPAGDDRPDGPLIRDGRMSHANAPLSVEGRRRLVEGCKSRLIAQVAAEMGISRARASKWVNRWRRHGDAGLHDRSSSPRRSPSTTPAWVITEVESWRREHKRSAQRITDELADLGFTINRRTVTRHLMRLGPGRRRFIDPGGDNNRTPGKITAR